MKTFTLISLALATAACGETLSDPPTQLNLDRPADVTFACYGGLRLTMGAEATPAQEIVRTAQPSAACTIRSAPREATAPVPVPPGQQDLTAQGGAVVPGALWYGLILQRGPGTVALSRFSTKPGAGLDGFNDIGMLDADPLTPGTNSISVGEDPVAIVTDRTGCKAVTANAGSCDLSVLDIGSAVDAVVGSEVARLAVTNGAGVPIASRPAAMVVEPQITNIGYACPATATGLAYIAYPSCRLVAGVDLATGQMVTGVQYDDAGVPAIVGADVTCPDECGVGTPALGGTRPVTLDLELDPRSGTRRLAIGAEDSGSVTIVELDIASRPLSLFQVALEDPAGTLGVTQLALTPEIGMGGVGATAIIDDENAPGGDFQFVYAVATDGTVRVADILNARRECDTQIDPRFLRENVTVAELACLPIGDPALPRRAGAKGPGIELLAGAVPAGVDIFRTTSLNAITDQSVFDLVGTYALVTALNGVSFVVNIDDDYYDDQIDISRPLEFPAALIVPHQMRDSINDRGAVAEADEDRDPSTMGLCEDSGPLLSNGAVEGGPRATSAAARNIPTGFYAAEKQTQLPSLRQLLCTGTDSTRAVTELQFAAPVAVRDQTFADLRALRGDENWTLTYEGSLSNDGLDSDVDGPGIRESMMKVDELGLHLVDQTRPFCDAGVEPYDIVQMRGCDPGLGDVECPIGYRCYVHPQSQVPGIGACMLDDEAERLAEACKDFLQSVRRYTVKQATTGELVLMPRRHELRTTPLDGCTSDAQCESLADYAAKTVTSRHPVDDQATVDNRTWVCRADPGRAPRGTNNQRCNLACDTNAECATGTVCSGGDAATPELEGLCLEGVIPPQACINAPQRYELRAGEAFTVVGSRSGYVHGTIAQGDVCVPDPDAHPLTVGRIPLEAPPCFADSDPITGMRPDGTREPNPCSTTIGHTEPVPNYVPGTCTLDTTTPSTLVERQAPAIRFRNRGMMFHLVDPYYPGDNRCIVDRQGPNGMPLDKVPVVFSGYQLAFRQVGGFSPLVAPIAPIMPKRVVRGPVDTVWVIDEGDFLSTSITQPSTRGKVYVVKTQEISGPVTLQ